MRDSVSILEATIEALGYNTDEFPMSKSSIKRVCTEERNERAEAVKANFQNEVPNSMTVHWDGKLLPAVDAWISKEEYLPIVIIYVNKEKFTAIPRLDSSSGSKQAQAVRNAIVDWNLVDKVQFFVVILRLQIHAYKEIDKSIAKAVLQKISQHLWYLTDKVSVLSLFDNDVDQETKEKMVET
ncbi:hypothetical protein J437_LFUL017664 [Ladona fulva]|uniref:Uncharacterized protein n=1 Tax=Ladona fulva TaxID=123851 RepID=A0A8K0KMG4_LADFU|nr:hypothetical protein J437_LFUL017664 [Ladona fulva]